MQFVAEPQTGLQIAFKMLDADGNEQVEKKEFFKVGVYTYILILKDLKSNQFKLNKIKLDQGAVFAQWRFIKIIEPVFQSSLWSHAY